MKTEIIIDKNDTENEFALVKSQLDNILSDIESCDSGTISAVYNCNRNIEKSNVCRKRITESIRNMGDDIQDLGIIFAELDDDFAKQWGED